MAQTILPHYEHHMREVTRTRRRFRLSLAVMFVVLFVALGLQARVSNAAAYYTASGRVFDGSTGQGLANIKLYLCWTGGTSFYVVTNSTGVWSASLPAQVHVCMRYSSGAPNAVTGPVAVNNQPEHAGAASYEYQVIGYNCYHVLVISSICWANNQTWDRTDTGYDFKFMDAAGASLAPSPAPKLTPVPTVAPKSPSPTPAKTPASSIPTFGSSAASAEGADVTPPTVPASFQATVADGSAVVSLTWDASTDANGIKGYLLERSLDQLSWEKVTDVIQGTSYTDKGAGYGIHYYYRLSASDTSGNTSGYATADVTTADFSATTDAGDATSYTSDDNAATVAMPAGAVPESTDCIVSTTTFPSGDHKPGSATQSLVAGPYALICKKPDGTQLTEFDKPITWSVNLKDKLKGFGNPRTYNYNPSGDATLINGAQFDSKSQVVRVASTSPAPVMVLADMQHGVSVNLVLGTVLLLGIVFGVAVLIVRKKQKTTYDDYIRKKYYNL